MSPRCFFVLTLAASGIVLATARIAPWRVEARQSGTQDKNEREANPAKADCYVAPNGNDENSGTLEQPFATLTRARDAVRRFKSGDRPKADMTVLVRGGTFVLKEPLAFGPEDSGTAEHRVVYAA